LQHFTCSTIIRPDDALTAKKTEICFGLILNRSSDESCFTLAPFLSKSVLDHNQMSVSLAWVSGLKATALLGPTFAPIYNEIDKNSRYEKQELV